MEEIKSKKINKTASLESEIRWGGGSMDSAKKKVPLCGRVSRTSYTTFFN